MLTVHHLGLSASERIVWLCEELGVAYDLIRYDRDPATRSAPPEYKALHPAGSAPIITDGDVVLAETGAIVEYIARRYGGGRLLLGPEDAGFADFLFWFHYANATMMARILSELVARRFAGAADMPKRSDASFALVEQRLGQAPFFAGYSFTAADIMMSFPLTTMRLYSGHDIAHLPALRAYLARIGERPAYRAALAKAEPGFEPKLG